MKYRSNSIITLISPTAESAPFFHAVLQFNRSLKMRIFILNILKISGFGKIFKRKKMEIAKKVAWEQLRQFLEKTVKNNVPVKLIPRVKTGRKLNILRSESKNGGYEFMVVCKNDGSSTRAEIDKIVSRAFCPVLVMDKNHSVGKIKKIAVPIDISQSTKKKLRWTTFFAKKFGAEVRIVSALNVDIQESKSLAYRNADNIRNMLTERGIACDIEVLKVFKKDKTEAILNFIRDEKPDLVVIRTHQESVLAGAQIGRFVSTVVHECKMPVFTVGRSIHPLPVDFES